MEQTLVYNDNLVGRISNMTIFEQFAQTVFVTDSQGIIDVENTYRELNSIRFIKTEIVYQLKNHRVISRTINSSNIVISDLTHDSTISIDKSICKCVSSDLNKLFFQELNRFESTENFEFNLFSQSIFKRLLNPNKNKDLINKFIEVSDGMSWAIIPYNLLHIFYESDKLTLSKEENDKIIYHLGSIEGVNIYVNPDDNSGKIFFGNFNSIIIIANRNMNIFDDKKGRNYNFEYLFLEHGKTKSLQIK